MSPLSRTPSARLPFTLVGATAGWVCSDVFRHPFLRWTHLDAKLPATFAGALAGMVIGHLLTRALRREEDNPLAARSGVYVRLALSMPAGGALAGLLLGLLVPDLDGLSAVGLGAVGGLAAWPLCWLVLGAAARAVRGRHGSIVASSDRRSVWTFTVTSAALLAGVMALDWPASRLEMADTPVSGLALAAVAAGALFALTLVDLFAFGRVRRDAPVLEERTEEHAADGGENVPRVDYGLGDEVRAEIVAGAAAYRSRGRVARLVLGAPGEALSVLRRALVRDVACFAVAALAVAFHLQMLSPAGTAMFHDVRCAGGSRWDCRQAEIAREEQLQRDGDEARAAVGLGSYPRTR